MNRFALRLFTDTVGVEGTGPADPDGRQIRREVVTPRSGEDPTPHSLRRGCALSSTPARGSPVDCGDLADAPTILPLVLIVEDDGVFRKAMAEHLLGRGFAVVSAASVRDGIGALSHAPGFLVLDLLLSDGNGVEVLREARRRGMDPASVVITVVTRHLALYAEMAEFRPDNIFLKPVEPKAVADWMVHFGGRRPGGYVPPGA